MTNPVPIPASVDSLVVVGAGAAGVELAFTARRFGWTGPITMLGDEAPLPYHRPPLSKAFLGSEPDLAGMELRPQSAYGDARIALHRGRRVVRIDRCAKALAMDDGETIPYARLALCTGGRPRLLAVPGACEAGNVHYLRTHADAEAIRSWLLPGTRLAIIGGGYVGLEIAASARRSGAEVTVIEAQDRLLARVASPEISEFFARLHRGHGVTLRTGLSVERIERDAAGNACAVIVSDGSKIAADAVVVGIGMLPNAELAAEAGLTVEGGIVVDDLSTTSDPAICAAGDCTVFDSALYGRRVRLESVPNALEQARAAASLLCGRPAPNRAVPWFWSDQYEHKLQMVGLHAGYDQAVTRGDNEGDRFSIFYLREGRVLAATSVNRPGEFTFAKRLAAAQHKVDPEMIANDSIPLKAIVAAAGPVTVAA